MKNVLRVFWRDVKRLARTPAAWTVVLFLMVLPSLYSWFNVAAFWDPYENTDHLRICVANEDAGADSELLGHLDVGSQLVEELEDNEQLDWVFVSHDEAIDQVNAGQAYAAFIIPEDFSAKIITLTTGDFEQPSIQYYVNEKAGPVAPKITDTGANTLDTSINDTFFATVSSTAATILNERLGESRLQWESTRGNALDRIDHSIEELETARQKIAEFNQTVGVVKEKASSAKSALSGAQTHIDTASAQIEQIASLSTQANTGLANVSSAISTSLDQGASLLGDASAKTSLALGKTAAAVQAARSALGIPSTGGTLPSPDYASIIALLEQVRENASDDQRERIDEALAVLRDAEQAGNDLSNLKEQIQHAAETAGTASDPVVTLTQRALESAQNYRTALSGNVIPAFSTGIADVSSAASQLATAIASQNAAISQAQSSLDELDSTLTLASTALGKTDTVLANLQSDLGVVRTDLASLASSGVLSSLIGEDGIDPDKLADFMMSPTQVEREELYPLNAYGSAMAPLFINLTLWIGVFMLMVIIRLEVDDEGIENLTIAQRSFGRALLLAIIAAMQAIICCVGCLLMGVQTANAPLFIGTAIIASLSYLAIQYTLSSTLQHVGKALCVIMVFVQIPGATGLYPVEMTNDFFQFVYPLFPFTYGINAMREAICGFYGNAWLLNIATLLAFLVGFALLGLVARPYMANLNRMFARQIEQSDIVIGESMQLPARRYRMSQIIKAFSNHDEYRHSIESRMQRFLKLYPKLKMGALIGGITIPVLATAIMAFAGVDKVIILTSWLIWFAVIVAYLITIEYLRDYLSHLMSLESMSDEQMRALFEERNRYTTVKPIASNLTEAADE